MFDSFMKIRFVPCCSHRATYVCLKVTTTKGEKETKLTEYFLGKSLKKETGVRIQCLNNLMLICLDRTWKQYPSFHSMGKIHPITVRYMLACMTWGVRVELLHNRCMLGETFVT